MSIKFIIARHNKDGSDIIKDYLDQSLDRSKDHVMEIWHGLSIFNKYNIGIDSWITNDDSPLTDDDIICFMHEDIKILDKDLHEKVEYIFKNRPKVGVLGVIGTKSFPRIGGWWLSDQNYHIGHISQGPVDGGIPFHMVKSIEYSEDIVSVDGCIMFVRGSLVKSLRFDDSSFEGYHFYDCDYCFSSLEKGFKIAIADILVEHKSPGPLGDDWMTNRNLFVKKWESKGFSFPITKDSFNI